MERVHSIVFLADLEEDDSDYMLPMININQLSDSITTPPEQSEETQQQQQQQANTYDDDAYVYFETPSSQ